MVKIHFGYLICCSKEQCHGYVSSIIAHKRCNNDQSRAQSYSHTRQSPSMPHFNGHQNRWKLIYFLCFKYINMLSIHFSVFSILNLCVCVGGECHQTHRLPRVPWGEGEDLG